MEPKFQSLATFSQTSIIDEIETAENELQIS